MELLKTYTVKVGNGDIWQFKYNLNGVLVFFNVMEGDLSEKQEQFLYVQGKFPWKETQIKEWSNLYKTIKVEIGDRDLSFNAFWKTYPYNPLSKKKIAQDRYEKLKEQEKIKILSKISEYVKLKNQQNSNFPYAEVFINQRWWDN
ncbi:hypothetical protein FPG87_12485 [Flavobacterium psychrophilum]|uniref:Uncharacterized protein n=1 Tax=Flavobacterium psychrophilum TaxID=96345 RepID=A0A7U2NHJ5_FLAPS|nr:hypothetical protein [Flavobacterium psychrophilum]MBF2091276.1 hypothetical protein [Flavobacterium psychrophilum]OAE92155.1 hypothetical protein SU65_10395 [Flavobacterium psychrophilum]OJH10059.1 hypothetical protein FPG87_12485 [Flavobacterium psychrophilum]QRE05311.1 hypothetical protein H0H26_06915 [Flavobacterium psychrophilum]SNA67037.1 conserved hypothetical protein [Flavobacterium psychrophilum]